MLNYIAIFCNIVKLIDRVYVKNRVIKIAENLDKIDNIVFIISYFNIYDVNN